MNVVDGDLLLYSTLTRKGGDVDSNERAAATRVKGDLLYMNQEGRGCGLK